MNQRAWRAILTIVISAVAAHSFVLGVALLFFPIWALHLVGWGYAGEAFWPSQAGLFLIILGVAYAASIRLRPLIWLAIGSKAGAFVFLVVSPVWLQAPRIVALLGCGDGLMGLALALAFWRLQRAERQR